MLRPPAPLGLPPQPVLPHFMQPPASMQQPSQTPWPTTEHQDPQLGRMPEDGIPYRGPHVLLREEEFVDATKVSSQFVSENFDTADEAQNNLYRQLIERVRRENGIVRVFSRRWYTRSDGRPAMMIYMTVEFSYRELDASKPRGRDLLSRYQAKATSLDQAREAANRGKTY
jgi:hypothetical protein